MKCSQCGQELENDALVCPFCGQAVSDEDRQQIQYGGKNLTKKEFLQLPGMKNIKTNINTSGIAMYVLGVINIALEVYMKVLPIDGILLILLGLGIHLGKSRVCALLCALYSGFNLFYTMYTTGQRSGVLILIFAIDAVIYTFKYHKAWNEYQKDGTLPVEKEKK